MIKTSQWKTPDCLWGHWLVNRAGPQKFYNLSVTFKNITIIGAASWKTSSFTHEHTTLPDICQWFDSYFKINCNDYFRGNNCQFLVWDTIKQNWNKTIKNTLLFSKFDLRTWEGNQSEFCFLLCTNRNIFEQDFFFPFQNWKLCPLSLEHRFSCICDILSSFGSLKCSLILLSCLQNITNKKHQTFSYFQILNFHVFLSI